MDGWVRVLRPFNSISVISRRWKGEHERLCAMKRRLGSGRISPPAGFEPATPWSEVGSANRSATRTLLGRHHFPHYKSMGAFCCHGNLTLMMLHIKFDHPNDDSYKIWSRLATGLRDIQVSSELWQNHRMPEGQGKSSIAPIFSINQF